MSETVMPGTGAEADTFIITPPKGESWSEEVAEHLRVHLAASLPALKFRIMIHSPMATYESFTCVPILNGPTAGGNDAFRMMKMPSEATFEMIAAALDEFPPQRLALTASSTATVAAESSLHLAPLGQRRQVH
jgi:hypothetical protein